MQKNFEKSSFISAALFGFIFLIPLIILEVVNRWQFHEDFPVSVFTFTWILQTLFILILTPLIKKLRAGKSVVQNPVLFLLQIAGLMLIAYIWVNWIVDQWPCLMGVPNCD